MGLESIPQAVRDKYHIEERGHAAAILASDYPKEFKDIVDCLETFVLKKSHILTPGGGRSPISSDLDGFLYGRGWREKSFKIKITIDGKPVPIPTHSIDDFKNEVGLEVEWNNKTEFYDRDLNNFRLLKDLRVLAVGVMITRMSELQALFNRLGKGKSYGASTTHWKKLIPKVDGGGAGGCPLLLIGMGMNCYDPHL
ncbi:MAG TPA: BglII/BstYI family type II restriction endonuclease [Terriglobia bacterium]|nr:BglII/BstYI family type II restriction endonuclease [Terriglobia bacterium]